MAIPFIKLDTAIARGPFIVRTHDSHVVSPFHSFGSLFSLDLIHRVISLATLFFSFFLRLSDPPLTHIRNTRTHAGSRAAADQDIERCHEVLQAATDELITFLLPEDPDDMKDVLLELRAGTGGDEACLFCLDVMRMYQRLAAEKGWSCQVISMSPQEGREVVLKVCGEDAHKLLRHESGGHRVQRVPVTGEFLPQIIAYRWALHFFQFC